MTRAPIPGPWVDPEKIDMSPWSNQDGIVKFIEFPVRIPSMSHHAFHLYWQRHHSPHVMNATGFSQFMRKYTTAHVYPDNTPGLPANYSQDTPFEGAAEVWVNSLAELEAWLSHPLYSELIAPDEPRFIRQDGSVEIVLTREERIYRCAANLRETDLTKVSAIYTRRSDLPVGDFQSQLSALARSLAATGEVATRLCQFVISHRLCDPLPAGMPFAPIDAVAEFWFRSQADVPPFFASPLFVQAFGDPVSAMLIDGRARAIVTKVHVVHDEFSFQPTVMQPIEFDWSG